MNNIELERLINGVLNSNKFKDYAPNGLQVEGRSEVKCIVTGVTACQALIDAAVELKADAILVHHGYFWKNEPEVVCGMKQRRLKKLLLNDINLYGYHLPLDAHETLGNNVQLAQQLNINITGSLDDYLLQGEFTSPISGQALSEKINQLYQRAPLHIADNAPATIKRIAWCTGGGQDYIDQAANAGVDAFITGEVSERTVHIAREMGIHFFAAGHHATERAGIKALGDYLATHYAFDVTFIDINNPV